MKKIIFLFIAFVCICGGTLWGGIDSHKTRYVGGTVPTLKENAEGTTSTQDEKIFVFEQRKGDRLAIRYDQINSLEYGQKAGRRLGLSLAISPLFLLAKKRRHFLTIGFLDDNKKQQAAVFELGKDIIRPTIASLESRTGKKVDYEDDEARNTAGAK
jgi:hypothetical protein